jgi:hypothetical protein
MRPALCVGLLLALPVAGAAGQHTPRRPIECRGQPISRIDVETRPPFTPAEGTFVSRTAQAARRIHATTRSSVVRRYLALEAGRPCTELRRTESERILRAQPFIADAAVMAFSDGPDSVAIHVTTIDELSVVLDGSLTTESPYLRSIRLGNSNLAGSGLYGTLQWRDGGGFRDGYGVRLIHYQLFGRPYQLETTHIRRPLGQDVLFEASHPYLTDLQRIAWRTHYGERDSYSRFLRGSDTAAWLPVKQHFADIGGVIRIGGPGVLVLLGGSLSQEDDAPGTQPLVLDRGTIRADTGAGLVGRYPERRQTRINALVGVRRLRFMRVTGFESLDGPQDVSRGFQFSTLFGRGMPMLDSGSDRGIFASTAVYGGFGSPSTFVSADLSIEGRREQSVQSWVGVISSAHVAGYVKRIPRHTIATSVEFTGGWDSRVPFQLSFEDREGGLRGFSRSRIGGGQRLVIRLEDRFEWRHFRRWATLGAAAFTDLGKLWAGDAPYGMDSKVNAGVGISLLASVPPQSQRLIRLDLAYPVSSDGPRGWDLRLTSRMTSRLFWREPGDLRHAREHSVPRNLFNWP